jgi:hypothetical protein
MCEIFLRSPKGIEKKGNIYFYLKKKKTDNRYFVINNCFVLFFWERGFIGHLRISNISYNLQVPRVCAWLCSDFFMTLRSNLIFYFIV